MKLPELNLLFLTFYLQARESVLLPPFLGSTLRGAFGTALKKVFCFVPHGECERCWFFEACPYQYIFESPNLIPANENHQLLKGQKEVPQPFIMIPPKPKRKAELKKINTKSKIVNFNEDYAGSHFSRGENLEFSILLVGKSVNYWAQILVAVRLLAEYGLGERRVPFTLTNAFAHNAQGKPGEIFSLEKPQISRYGVSPIDLSFLVSLHVQSLEKELKDNPQSLMKIDFETPTRIRIADEVEPTVQFSAILKKITERLEFLAFLHADNPQKVDYRPLLNSAKDIITDKSFLKLYHFDQFSNAQNRKNTPRSRFRKYLSSE